MNDPRVLFITGEYPPMSGGIADYTSFLKSALERQGTPSAVLSRHGTTADEVVETWSWNSVRTVRDIVDRLEIDIVHIQYQAGAFNMHLALNALPMLLRNIPVVTTFHDLRPPYLFPKAGRVRSFAMKRMARASATSIVTNPRDACTLAGADIKLIQVPLGPSLPAPDEDIETGRAVGYFGFPSRQKGFDRLLDAIGRFPRDTRPPLIVVGDQPPNNGHHGFMTIDDVNEIAHTHGVNVSWTGFLVAQAASNALARCAVLAFPFPAGATQRSSALTAALQSGRPVITTSPDNYADLEGLSELPQLIQIQRDDTEALHRALVAALTTTSHWQPLPSEYAWASIAARHADLYQTLLGEARH